MESTLITELPFLDQAPAPAATVVPTLPATVVGSGLKRRLLMGLMQLVEARLLGRYMRTPRRVKEAAAGVKQLKQAYYGELQVQKVACVAGRYYREYQTPGWPSTAYDTYVATTLNRLVPFRGDTETLHLVFLAITKKCPLACEHCFEWEALNQKEVLSLAQIQEMVAQFQARHVSQIFFSGGEPMLRAHDLVQVLRGARPGTDFWVITSGFNFTLENARKLKAAGLTGVTISLDHHEEAHHNAFRGSAQAYANAIQAAVHAQATGLVVNLSLCVTREFTTEANLMRYAQLARQLGVAFVQILEPQAVGHYAGQNVALRPDQLQLLEDFYVELNFNSDYQDWPIVHYYGYHQRRMGCSGGADRFLYVDTDGDLHACPFCQKKSGSALGGALDASLEALCSGGCGMFPQAQL